MSVYDDAIYMFEAGKMLDTFAGATCEMNAAARAMLALSKAVPYPDKRRRYDRAHKKMVRLIREWNQIEHEREAEDAKAFDGTRTINVASEPASPPPVSAE